MLDELKGSRSVSLLMPLFIGLLLVASPVQGNDQAPLSVSSIGEADFIHTKASCSRGGLYFKLPTAISELPEQVAQDLEALAVVSRMVFPDICFVVVKMTQATQEELLFNIPKLAKTGSLKNMEMTKSADSFVRMILKEVFDLKIMSTEPEIDAFLNDKSGVHTPSVYITSKAFKDIALELGSYLTNWFSHGQWFRFGLALVADSEKYLKPSNAHSVLITRSRFDNEQKIHIGDWSSETILKHLESASNPRITDFEGEDSPSRILGRSIPCLFLLGHRKDSEAYRQFHKVAESLRNDILFVWANPSSEVSQHLLRYLRFNPEDIGNGVWLLKHQHGTVHKWSYPHSEITEKQIQVFVQDYLANKIDRHLSSLPVPPEVENQGPVIAAVGKTFKSLVIDSNQNVVVDFYGRFCGHCVTFAPVFEEIAREMIDSGANIRFVKIEMTQNEIEAVQVYSFPTIMIFPAKRKKNPVQFEGNRNKQTLIEFFKNNMDVDAETNAVEDI